MSVPRDRLQDNDFDFLANRYSSLRQLTPQFLAAFALRSPPEHEALLAAIPLLQRLKGKGRRRLPAHVPTGSYLLPRTGSAVVHANEFSWERVKLWFAPTYLALMPPSFGKK